jgi:hypothetical protein
MTFGFTVAILLENKAPSIRERVAISEALFSALKDFVPKFHMKGEDRLFESVSIDNPILLV